MACLDCDETKEERLKAENLAKNVKAKLDKKKEIKEDKKKKKTKKTSILFIK